MFWFQRPARDYSDDPVVLAFKNAPKHKSTEQYWQELVDEQRKTNRLLAGLLTALQQEGDEPEGEPEQRPAWE